MYQFLPFALSALAAFLLGSLSFSIIFTKLFTRVDVREHGSGNAGTTNVLRTAGPAPAILTFVFDFFKAVAAVFVAWVIFRAFTEGAFVPQSFSDFAFGRRDATVTAYLVKYIAGLACILGHIYPVFFGFRGGKGVLATAGIMLMVDWRVCVIAVSIFIVLVAATRYVSLGSVCAAASLPVLTFIFQLAAGNRDTWLLTILALLFAALLIFKHHSNISRLLHGTESKLGAKKKAAE